MRLRRPSGSWAWPLCLLLVQSAQSIQLPAKYDTIWTTQSSNAAGSMPVGGGDVGLNAWVESGQLLFYIAKSGAFDENNSLLKLGRVRLSMTPNPFKPGSTPFEQHLYINDGYVTFSGANDTLVKLWVDVDTSNIHTEITSSIELSLTAAFESWRTEGHTMGTAEQTQTSWGVHHIDAYPAPYQYPDTIGFDSGGVLSYHHNSEMPLFDAQIIQQGLSGAHPESFYNPMKNNTARTLFGTFMFSPQLKTGAIGTGKYQSTNYTSYSLVSQSTSKSIQLYIATGQEQTTDVDTWAKNLINNASSMASETQESSLSYWHSFWDRSYIIINPNASPTDSGFQVGKNYQYFRYMMACNGKGKFPTRFNGGIFTFDPILVSSGSPFSPDFRDWSGGTFTAQNQRLVYWPLIASGDIDILTQEFNFYQNFAPTCRQLGKTYFGLDVCLTSEQIDNTGLPNIYEYDADEYSDGKNRTSLFPAGIDFNGFLSWLEDGANEFVDMIVLTNLHFGLDISPWLPFVEYQLAWYDEYYQKRNGLDKNGDLIIYPGSSSENFKLALNSGSTVSGLRKTINDLLLSNPNYIKGNSSYYKGYLSRVPPTPLRACPGAKGLTCIAPAVNWSTIHTGEVAALYPLFPWGEYGLGQPTNLSYAMNTYFNDSSSASYHGTYGWHQDQIWFARMGLTSQVTSNTIDRFSDSTKFRFPTFKGPNYDWAPDMNHYGSAAIGLQEMLMQTFARNNSQIRLLPAWPSNWSGYFKLSAPFNTTVSANISGKAVANLVVEPSSRLADVVYGTA